MDDYLKLVIRLQAIVQNVLVYANNEFDKERYEEIGDIACHLMEYKTDLPFKKNYLNHLYLIKFLFLDGLK